MKKANLKKLGKNIKYARKANNLSQEELAEMLKLSRNYIGMIERAEVNAPVATLFDIAKALKVNVKSFLILIK